MKKILKIVGIIFIAFIALGIISSLGKSGNNTSNSANTNSTVKSDTKEVKLAGLNESVTDGDLSFMVTNVSKVKTLGNQFTSKTAQGIYYVVSLKIENTGKKTATFDSSMAKITDDQGREFERSIDGQTAKGLSQGKVDLFLQQIQPGLSYSGDLVFDLPETINNPVLVAKGSLFSQGAKIKLQ